MFNRPPDLVERLNRAREIVAAHNRPDLIRPPIVRAEEEAIAPLPGRRQFAREVHAYNVARLRNEFSRQAMFLAELPEIHQALAACNPSYVPYPGGDSPHERARRILALLTESVEHCRHLVSLLTPAPAEESLCCHGAPLEPGRECACQDAGVAL